MASKANGNVDDPGAFPAREWLRKRCVGKQVAFETRLVLSQDSALFTSTHLLKNVIISQKTNELNDD